MVKTAVVFTDGACVNQGSFNPRAGYGVYWGDNHENNRSGRVDGLQDSNRAELHAAHQAIKTAINQHYDSIEIHTDSDYVRQAVNGASGFASAGQNRDLMQSIHDLTRQIKVTVVHVQGHSNHHGNVEANRLAREGAKQ